MESHLFLVKGADLSYLLNQLFTMLRALEFLVLASVMLVSALNVTVPVNPPSGAQPLSPTLISFSIEQDRWPDWTGVNARNDFTFNALKNLADITGVPPKIRVGANSEDHTVWSPTVTVSWRTTSFTFASCAWYSRWWCTHCAPCGAHPATI